MHPERARKPSKLCSKSNTRGQHFLKQSKRLKRRHMLDFFASRARRRVPDWNHVKTFGCSRLSHAPGGGGTGLSWKVMGIVMKKVVLWATALAMVSGSALAADMA